MAKISTILGTATCLLPFIVEHFAEQTVSVDRGSLKRVQVCVVE